MNDGLPPAGLNPRQLAWLKGTLAQYASDPASVSDNHLAAARNYAARGGLASTLGALEHAIEVRGSGAQTEEASARAAAKGGSIIPGLIASAFVALLLLV